MSHGFCIGIVDDDESVRAAVSSLVRSMGFNVLTFPSAEDFLRSEFAADASCLVLDVEMPGMSGLTLQRYLGAAGRRIPIVFITAYADAGVRDRALEAGAVRFLSKPCDEIDLISAIRSALESPEIPLLRRTMTMTTPRIDGHSVSRPLGDVGRTDEALVGQSPSLREALDRLERVAPLDTTVLLTGETGTGKELMARILHRRSRRANHPLVAVNLAAIPEPLVASELFGHESGAFTGATQRRIGRFELADRATMFLDEVGELSPDMQVALLRVVQEGEFERLGASHTKRVDVRMIAATNRSLEQAVEDGRFRADLFYRLSVFPIHLPPLRERRDDIPDLVDFFMERLAGRLNRHFTGIEPESLDRLISFSWPGNIRQLHNVVEHSAILCDDPMLKIPQRLIVEQPSVKTTSRLDLALRSDERRMIEQALEEAEGRVAGSAGAAARLGVPASTLESKIKRFSIDKLRYRAGRE